MHMVDQQVLREEKWEVCMLCEKQCPDLHTLVKHIETEKHQRRLFGAMSAWSKAPASGGKTGGTSSSSQPASGGGVPSWRVRLEAEQAQAAQSLEEEYSMIGSCGAVKDCHM